MLFFDRANPTPEQLHEKDLIFRNHIKDNLHKRVIKINVEIDILKKLLEFDYEDSVTREYLTSELIERQKKSARCFMLSKFYESEVWWSKQDAIEIERD